MRQLWQNGNSRPILQNGEETGSDKKAIWASLSSPNSESRSSHYQRRKHRIGWTTWLCSPLEDQSVPSCPVSEAFLSPLRLDLTDSVKSPSTDKYDPSRIDLPSIGYAHSRVAVVTASALSSRSRIDSPRLSVQGMIALGPNTSPAKCCTLGGLESGSIARRLRFDAGPAPDRSCTLRVPKIRAPLGREFGVYSLLAVYAPLHRVEYSRHESRFR